MPDLTESERVARLEALVGTVEDIRKRVYETTPLTDEAAAEQNRKRVLLAEIDRLNAVLDEQREPLLRALNGQHRAAIRFWKGHDQSVCEVCKLIPDHITDCTGPTCLIQCECWCHGAPNRSTDG